MPSDKDKWRIYRERIIEAADILAEYERIGCKFTTREPNSSGWVQCHALGRTDNNPSANVRLPEGIYKDFGGGVLPFFDALATFGPYADAIEAQKELAKRYKVKLPAGCLDGRPRDSIRFDPNPLVPVRCLKFLKKYGVTIETVRELGGIGGQYHKSRSDRTHVVVLPVFGPTLGDEPAEAFVLHASNGLQLPVWKGKGENPHVELVKRKTIGRGGCLLNEWAMKHWEDAERIYKVEGVSDMMALHQLIPDGLKIKHLVVTNPGGATETGVPREIAHHFQGKDVVIIHDQDEAGERGAGTWVNELSKIEDCTVRHVKLPYEMQENHGKDLRDWLAAGNGYGDLLMLVDGTEVERKAEEGSEDDAPGLTRHQEALKRLGIRVLGHEEDSNVIVCFNEKSGRTFRIPQVERYAFESMLLHMGGRIEAHIDLSNDPDPSKLSIPQIRRAIAVEGERRAINAKNSLGIGIWELNSRLLLVQPGEVVTFNGVYNSHIVPEIDGMLFDFRGQEWFESAGIEERISKARDKSWREQKFDETTKLFKMWNNWVNPDIPDLITCLVCASWVQSVWHWRPQIFILGNSSSGKSTLMEDFISRLFGNLVHYDYKPTEAGVRQALQNTSLIPIVDELEKSRHRQSFYEMVRVAGKGGEITRGTTHHKAIRFLVRHMFWLGSTNTGMEDVADKNRYIFLGLNPATKRTVVEQEAEYLKNLGWDLLAAMLVCSRPAKTMAWEIREEAKANGVSPRTADNFSVPSAVMATMLGESAEFAYRVFEIFCQTQATIEEVVSDEESLVSELFDSQVFLKGGQRATISELCASDVSYDWDEEPNVVLARQGIRIDRGEWIFCQTASIKKLVDRDSRFHGQRLDQILIRIPGASRERMRVGTASNRRGIKIPWDAVVKSIGDVNRLKNDGVTEDAIEDESF